MRHFSSLILSILFLLIGCGGSGNEESPTTPAPPTLPPTTQPPTTPPNDTSKCSQQTSEVNWDALMAEDCENLSDYGLFIDPQNPTQSPRKGGFAYQLSTELFSNYASKYRFIFLQENQTMTYRLQTDSSIQHQLHTPAILSLPVGSVLVKTFALPFDTQVNTPENETLIETRLLIHRETGWTALTYQWDNAQAQSTASLLVPGADVQHILNNQGETYTFNYHIPSKAECKICHQVTENGLSKIMPIGLKDHVLNREVNGVNGQPINQLQYWQQLGKLNELPTLSMVPKSFALHDTHTSLEMRAKGYLDINCAHCHNPKGFASISGLRLGFEVDHTSAEYGICKQPPGYDGGPNNLAYDIVPGNGERSIVHNRQVLLEAKDKMPPIGRELVHIEGVDVVKHWIDSLSPTLGNCQ